MIAQDILGKVRLDFQATDDRALVISLLEDFKKQKPELASDRILRCIVFVANGDLDRLGQALDLAAIDYRDLIVWAEYDREFNQIRDLSLPFSPSSKSD